MSGLTLFDLGTGKTEWRRPFTTLRYIKYDDLFAQNLKLDFGEYGGWVTFKFLGVPARVGHACVSGIIETKITWRDSVGVLPE